MSPTRSIDAVKGKADPPLLPGGRLRRRKPGRNYYTEFVEKAPNDSVVLTLACGKFRFFDKDLGDIGGIPRLLDVGQCNDAYSAIQIAVALAKAFNCGVNDLPLSMILSWYEQKAVAILLTLLYLGIKNIRLGPSLPAFITPNVLDVLVENFDITPITTPDEDLKAILGNHRRRDKGGLAGPPRPAFNVEMGEHQSKETYMRCPGRTRATKPGAIFEAPCPQCGQPMEFFKDDTTRKCEKCGHRCVNPQWTSAAPPTARTRSSAWENAAGGLAQPRTC